MVKDECILVDEQDNVMGHANKYQSHRCGPAVAMRASQSLLGCAACCRRCYPLLLSRRGKAPAVLRRLLLRWRGDTCCPPARSALRAAQV